MSNGQASGLVAVDDEDDDDEVMSNVEMVAEWGEAELTDGEHSLLFASVRDYGLSTVLAALGDICATLAAGEEDAAAVQTFALSFGAEGRAAARARAALWREQSSHMLDAAAEEEREEATRLGGAVPS